MACILPAGCCDPRIAAPVCNKALCWADKFEGEERARLVHRNAAPIDTGPAVSVPAERGHYVYIHRDADGEALYVGQSDAPVSRIGAHITGSPWWPRVASIDWLRYPNSAAAKLNEGRLISQLDPPHNTLDAPSRGKRVSP